jgi:type VI secretion system secreted protein VgrG
MNKFSEQVHISISSFTQNVIHTDLKLTQIMADHHRFSFLWQYTGKAVIEPDDQASAFSKHIGAEVIFTFKVNGIRLMSKGIIADLVSIDLNGSPAGLHVIGISHTIVLDDMKKSRIFLEKNLQEIGLELFAEESSGEFYQREAIIPTHTKTFKYKTQYNETSFDFLKRLSARYGQWFYFDGMRMQYGQTKTSKVKLINGASLHHFKIHARLVSHKSSFGGYDYNNASKIRNASEKTTTGSRDRFSSIVGYNQGSVARQGLNHGAYTNNAQNKDEIDEMVKLQTAGRDANSVFYSGTSYYPIGLGQVFTIQNKKVMHELVAIEVIHHSKAHGNYNCEFKAIPADVAAPHYTDVDVVGYADNQPAIIKDNNDPEEMGRVKVEFYWAGWGNTSEWMRVVQHYAGTDRGGYWTPEIGDEVQVSFEGGNADCPYVSASYYNGKAKPEFFDTNNMIKGWRLKFGQLFKFVEKVGIWLSDPSGNEVHLDEQKKNMNFTSPETVTVRAKNIVFEATESITFKAGQNISSDAGLDYTCKAGKTMLNSATGDYLLTAFDINELAHGGRNSQAKNIQEQAGAIDKHSTSENVNVQGQKKINTNSGEDSSFN